MKCSPHRFVGRSPQSPSGSACKHPFQGTTALSLPETVAESDPPTRAPIVPADKVAPCRSPACDRGPGRVRVDRSPPRVLFEVVQAGGACKLRRTRRNALTFPIPDYDEGVSASVTQTHGHVPFLDLARTHAPLVDVFTGEFEALLESSTFVNGKQVETFESEFAKYCGTLDAVGVASGLDALRLALAASDVGTGGEVIVPAMTFVATWEAVSQVGAVPVPVDITDDDYNLDIGAVEAAITSRTIAIVPVHLYGQMAEMDGLLRIASRNGLRVIEDAAQAHGATRDDHVAGASGHAAAFSFYPAKNLGAVGDAGAMTTNDEQIAFRVRALREHGQSRKYHHDEIGWTARLDTIQAAILLIKLGYLNEWNDQRRAIAALYLDALAGVGDLDLPNVPDGSSPVWHLFVVRTTDPVGLADHMSQLGVASSRHYPQPPHMSRAYSSLGYPEGAFPVAEAVGRECISLPIFPAMTETEVLRVTDAVKSWFDGA